MTALVEIDRVTKSYPGRLGRRTVLRELNLTLERGRNVGLIGANGAGKSTLMRLLGGVEAPDSGRIVSHCRVSWPIGLAGGFQGSLSGRDNARFVCRIHAVSGDAMRAKVDSVERFAEIGSAFDLPVKSYSSGMRSRLTFALAMAFEFDLYLIDEVTAVGDADFKRKSRAELERRLANANVVYTSHNMDEIARLCNQVVLLEPGAAPRVFDDVKAGIAAYQKAPRTPVPRDTRQPALRQAQGERVGAAPALRQAQGERVGAAPALRQAQGERVGAAPALRQAQGERVGGEAQAA